MGRVAGLHPGSPPALPGESVDQGDDACAVATSFLVEAHGNQDALSRRVQWF